MAYSLEERERISIYALCDPRDGRVRYIGKAKDPDKRFKGHLREVRRRSPLYSWISSLAKKKLQPILQVIEICDGSWQEAEKRIIAEYRSKFSDLLNLADGGDEPHCPLEVRRNNARQLNQDIASDPLRKRVRDLNRYMAAAYNRGSLKDHHLASLRLAAEKAPHLFGMWASV